MLNDFKEWLSDNLRYILLGLAVILILVIAFFAIRLISGFGSSEKKEPETETVTEVMTTTESETTAAESQQLEKNVPEVLGLIEKYYTARQNKDYETLAAICEDFGDSMQAQLEREDAAVEGYSNFMTYSKPGLTEGSYVVYVYVETKLTGIATQAPSLLEKYVLPDAEGNLMIAETDRSTEIKEYTQRLQADDDVQALINDVNTALANAMEADEDLKNFVESQSSGTSAGGTDSGEGSGEDAGDTAAAATTGTMQATTEVNVRGTASADATLYGVLTTGQQVEVLENLDSGWSKIRYTVNDTTIEGYVMTQYLGAVQ